MTDNSWLTLNAAQGTLETSSMKKKKTVLSHNCLWLQWNALIFVLLLPIGIKYGKYDGCEQYIYSSLLWHLLSLTRYSLTQQLNNTIWDLMLKRIERNQLVPGQLVIVFDALYCERDRFLWAAFVVSETASCWFSFFLCRYFSCLSPVYNRTGRAAAAAAAGGLSWFS